MTSSEICGVVNALTRTVCDLKINSQNCSRDLCIFNTDFYKNRRLILFSFLNYDYITKDCVKITCDELDIMREFLLTYIEKFITPNIGTVFISYVNKRLRFSFCYYERASKTTETCDTLKLIEDEINTVFDGSIFRLLQPFFNNIPPNTPISNIKNLHLYFKEGYYYLKCNVNGLMNYSELEKTVLEWKSSNEIPINGSTGNFISGSYYETNICQPGCGNHPSEPYEPNEPFAPFEPYAPYAPSDPPCPTKEQKRVLEDIENTDYFNIVNKKLDKKELSKNTLSGVESAEKYDGNIRAAISRILEISSTDELTSL
jgi:hypothetical protein